MVGDGVKTLLFVPPKFRDEHLTINDCCWGTGQLPVTPSRLLAIGSYLKAQGDQVLFLDAGALNMSWAEVWKFLEKKGADRLIFQVIPQFESWQMIIVGMCKALDIEPVVMGITEEHERALHEDYHYLVTEFSRISIPTFDKLPGVDWNLIGKGTHDYYLTYQIAEGCPYKCKMCIWSKKEFKMRDPEMVINDLRRVGSEQPIYLLCAQITTNKKWLERFVELKKEFNLGFEYVTDLHCKETTDEKIEMLVESGCVQATMGVESTNQDILDKINKGITIDDIENAVIICKKHKLSLTVPFLYGIDPNENVENDIEFFKQYKSFTPSVGIMKIYTGTPLWEARPDLDYIFESGTNAVAVNRGVTEALKRVEKWEGVLNG